MVEKISRSEKKRLFKQVEDLAKELSELSDNDLSALEAEEEVKLEIQACRGLKAGARKRQIKYLAKVLRNYSMDSIYLFLKEKKGSELKRNKLFHRAERWRDVVVNEALEMADNCRREQVSFEPDFQSGMISDLLRELPTVNENELRQCAYQYARTRNKTHFKEIFRMVKAALDQEERNKK